MVFYVRMFLKKIGVPLNHLFYPFMDIPIAKIYYWDIPRSLPMGPACGRRRHRALLIHHDGGLVDHVVQVDCGIILDLMA